jgi:hypothetical protein
MSSWLKRQGFRVREWDYDIFATRADVRLLLEVKTITATSVKTRVMMAIGQLAYYRAVSVPLGRKGAPLYRVVVFNQALTDVGALRALQHEAIEVVWMDQGDPRFTSAKFRELVAKPN